MFIILLSHEIGRLPYSSCHICSQMVKRERVNVEWQNRSYQASLFFIRFTNSVDFCCYLLTAVSNILNTLEVQLEREMLWIGVGLANLQYEPHRSRYHNRIFRTGKIFSYAYNHHIYTSKLSNMVANSYLQLLKFKCNENFGSQYH